MKANNILKFLPCLAAFLTIPAIPANAGDDEKVTLNKTATYNYETQTGEITLETYLQGGVRTTASTSSTKPLDVLMVLDYSGTMTNDYSDSKSKTYNTYSVAKHTYNEWYKNQKGYSVKVGTENCTVSCVTMDNPNDSNTPLCWAYVETGDYTRYYLTLDGMLYKSNDKSPSATSYPKSVDGVTIYPTCGKTTYLFGITSAKNSVSVTNRITGLKAAVGTFIDLLYENAKSTGATHRVSILEFQNPRFPKFYDPSSSRAKYIQSGETSYYLRPFWAMKPMDSDNTTRDWWDSCTGVMTQFRSVVEDNTKEAMKASLELANTGGSTAIDYAMYMASLQIQKARSDAEKIIIVFTDGKPTHASGAIPSDCAIPSYSTVGVVKSNDDVADGAIKFSQECKKIAKVYTIGLFTNDQPAEGFMEALSSNYPNATSIKNKGTAGAEQTFSVAINGTSGNLTETFENIANASIGKATFTTETIIQDAMNMKYFKLPNGMTTDDVKLYTDACTDYDPSTKAYTFANSLQPLTLPANSITVDGDSIVKIKGFDFQANWCGLVNTTPHGNRLVAKFPFELKGGDNMPTNVLTNDGTKSGLIPKPESGAYPSAPTDAALKFPTPSLKFATIEIVRNGLDAGESAIYIVTCGTDTVACVSVNGVGANQPVSKFIYGLEAGAGKMYKVTETNWNWAYEKDPTSGYIEKEVNPSDNSAVKFEFGGTHIKKSSTDPTQKLHPAEIHNHDEQYIPNIINVESL